MLSLDNQFDHTQSPSFKDIEGGSEENGHEEGDNVTLPKVSCLIDILPLMILKRVFVLHFTL